MRFPNVEPLPRRCPKKGVSIVTHEYLTGLEQRVDLRKNVQLKNISVMSEKKKRIPYSAHKPVVKVSFKKVDWETMIASSVGFFSSDVLR